MTRKTHAALALAIVLALAAAAAAGQHDPEADHAATDHAPDAPPAVAAYAAANARMHRDMAIAYTGDADVDFAFSMIPHHQGAIDMAQVVLEHGQDPRIRTLAEAIVAAQEAEVAFLRGWLADRGY